MKQEIAALWTKALRSGAYAQDKEALRTKRGFCCLGILCEISGLGEWKKTPNSREQLYIIKSNKESQAHLLPETVEKWAGLFSWNPGVAKNILAEENDQGKSFEEIADLIDAHWEEL